MHVANTVENETPQLESVLVGSEPTIGEKYVYWKGTSDRRYLHTVFDLKHCPPLPRINYILVHRDEEGRRTPLHVGYTVRESSSLNLAHLRQKGASLGANEVHIHLLTESDVERKLIEFDLRTLAVTSSIRRMHLSPANSY